MNLYYFGKKEIFLQWFGGFLVVIVFAYFFYRSVWAVIVLLPVVFLYRKMAIEKLKISKREELLYRFKEIIEIVAGNLRAGYSVENAFIETGKEILRLHHAGSLAGRFMAFIKRGLENNIPLEERLKEAGEISGINEITEFAAVFNVAKNSGGNIIDCISQFTIMISDKIETEKEINVILSARRGEQKIMNLVPFIILFYLDITSPDFFSALYHNLVGISVMTVCLGLYLAAYGLSVKMLRIEV